MKAIVRQLLKCLTLGVGVVLAGIMLVPAGILVMLISVVWKATDRLIRLLDGKKEGA